MRTDARRHHDPQVRGFASDNYAGAHPEILAALALANGGHQVAYGEDDYTGHLQRVMHGLCLAGEFLLARGAARAGGHRVEEVQEGGGVLLFLRGGLRLLCPGTAGQEQGQYKQNACDALHQPQAF